MKKLGVWILSILFLLTAMPLGVVSAADTPVISAVTDATVVERGATFTASVRMDHNPGLLGWHVLLRYDTAVMEIVSVTAGTAFDGVAFGPQNKAPFSALWTDALHGDNMNNGTLYTITFAVKANAPLGVTNVYPSYDDPDSMYNEAFGTVSFGFHGTTVEVVDHVHVYDNTCDAVCNVCGAVRDASHTFVNHADPICTVCGATPAVFTAPTVYNVLEKAVVEQGETFTVTVQMINNPGLLGWQFLVDYDTTVLELTSAAAGTAFDGVAFGPQDKAPFSTLWFDALHGDNVSNGVLYTLTFRAKDDATIGTSPIRVGYVDLDNMYNDAFETVLFAYNSATVEVVDHIHVYDNTCDAACNICGAVRDASHTFVNHADPICAVCGATPAVFTAPTVYNVLEKAVVEQGETFTVTVQMINNPGLLGWQFLVDYDTAVLELMSAAAGTAFDGVAFGPQDKAPFSTLWFDALHGDDVSNGVLYTLTFRAKDDATIGNSPIRVGYADLESMYNAAFETVLFAYNSAMVEVVDHIHVYDHACDAGCNICGAVREVAPHDYTAQVTMEPTCITEGVMTYTCSICGDGYDEPISTNDNHTYDYPCSETCSACNAVNPDAAAHTYSHIYDQYCDVCDAWHYVELLYGDVNADGKVNIRDLGVLQQCLNGWEVDAVMDVADVNDDGKVNIRDLGVLQQHLNGWDVELGPAKPVMTVVTDQAKILDDITKLGKNATTPYIAQLTGKVLSTEEYDSVHDSITVTMRVEEVAILCYQMKGNGVDKVKAGDTITVKGVIKNYFYEGATKGEIEFSWHEASGTEVTLVKLVPCAVQDLSTTEKILDAAFKLRDGESLQQEVALTGKVIDVETPFSSEYANITVNIVVEGKTIKCYRLQGNGVDKIRMGDTITVKGRIKNYNGIIEFDVGCQMTKRVAGTTTGPVTDQTKILAEAFALAPGATLTYQARLTGTITWIETEYSEPYKNITVFIEVGGRELRCYRLRGDGADSLKVGDVITVTGLIKNYQHSSGDCVVEFDAGCTFTK